MAIATTQTATFPDIFDDVLEGNTSTPTLPGVGIRAPENVAHKRLYLAVGYLFRHSFNLLQKRKDAGGADVYPATDSRNFDLNFEPAERNRFAAVFGQLVLAGFEDPSLGRLERGSPGPRDIDLNGQDETGSFGLEPVPDPTTPSGWTSRPFRVLIVPEFVGAFQDAFRSYNENSGLFDIVFEELMKEAIGRAAPPAKPRIETRNLAAVTQRLVTKDISPDDPFIRVQVRNALSQVLGGVLGADPSAISIEPPDLDTASAIEIIPDNVRAVRMIYFSAQLEEMKVHSVNEKVLEHFHVGLLPITRGRAADKMYAFFKRSPDRLNEMERRALYGRVLGFAQGNVKDTLPNREFSTLWLRFLSTVSQKFREVSSFERDQVSVEQVHKSARDLAVNLSLHGYGLASPGAAELQAIIDEIFSIFDEKEVQMAYGVRDRYQLVDRVANLYLGGGTNGVKYRTLASTGEKIIKFLADSAPVLASGSAAGLNIVTWNGQRRIPTPAFTALAELCERWLAATGTTDAVVERNTEPVELSTQYTAPMLGAQGAMPQAVQDALNQVRGGLALPNLPIPQA
jgi:hypothetical protein